LTGQLQIPPLRSSIPSRAVLPTGDLGEQPLGRHLRDLKSQYFPGPWLHSERYAEWLALGVFTGFEVIKLNQSERPFLKLHKPERVLTPGFFG
jgi:hypothetical protein